MPARVDLEQRLQGATEALYEDERLRSQLTDEEANLLLQWGEQSLAAAAAGLGRSPARGKGQTAQFDAALARVRAALAGINDLAGERSSLSQDEVSARVAAIVAAWNGAPAAPGASHPAGSDLPPDLDTQQFIARVTGLLR